MLNIQPVIPRVAVNPFERTFIRKSEKMAAEQQLWGGLGQPPPNISIPGSTPMSWTPLWAQIKDKTEAEAQVIIKDHIDALMSAADTPRQKKIVEDLQADFEAVTGGAQGPLSAGEINTLAEKAGVAMSFAWGDRANASWPPKMQFFTRPVQQYLVGLGLLGVVAGLVWWQRQG